MKFRRSIAMLCAVTLSLSMFAGCAKVEDQVSSEAQTSTQENKTAEPKQELNIAVFQGGYGREIWDQIAKKFESENEGITVNVNANPDIGAVIQPSFQTGKDVPDFIYLASTNKSGLLQSLISDEQLVELSDVFDDGLKAKLLPGALEGPTIQPYGDGKIYSAPLFYSVMGLWYDSNLFKTNNWEAPKTWDEFFALGDKANKKNMALYTYAAGNAPGYNESVAWPAIASAAGTDALKDIFNYKEGAWKKEGVKKVLDVFEKISKDRGLMDGTLGMTHTQTQEQFIQDKVLFMPNGTWVISEMKNNEKAPGFTWAYAGLPAFTSDSTKYIWASSEEMYIPKKAKNIELAKKFMKFLYEEDTIKMMSKATNAIPPVKGIVDQVKDQLDPTTYSIFKTAEDYTLVTGGFATISQSEINIRKDFFRGINDIMAGKQTPDGLIKKMEEEAKKVAPLVLKK